MRKLILASTMALAGCGTPVKENMAEKVVLNVRMTGDYLPRGDYDTFPQCIDAAAMVARQEPGTSMTCQRPSGGRWVALTAGKMTVSFAPNG